MPEVVLASASATLRREVGRALTGHRLSVAEVTSGTDLARLATGSWRAETRVAVIDLGLPLLTDQQIRLVHAQTPPATGFIFLWGDARDVRRVRNVTFRQCRFVSKSHGSVSGKKVALLRELIDGILAFASPRHGVMIQDVILESGHETLLIVFRNGRSYRLYRRLIPDIDRTAIKRVWVHSDGSAFGIEQESGGTADVPWDFVLYHREPRYEYFRGRGDQERSERLTARRIGERLKVLRKTLGLTASEVASRSGILRPNISRIESGKHVPSLDTLERLAGALGVPVRDWLAG